MTSNFNPNRNVQKMIVTGTPPLGRIKNFRSYYVNASRTVSASSRTVAVPLDIRAKENVVLLAEYAATPSRRLDSF